MDEGSTSHGEQILLCYVYRQSAKSKPRQKKRSMQEKCQSVVYSSGEGRSLRKQGIEQMNFVMYAILHSSNDLELMFTITVTCFRRPDMRN